MASRLCAEIYVVSFDSNPLDGFSCQSFQIQLEPFWRTLFKCSSCQRGSDLICKLAVVRGTTGLSPCSSVLGPE